MHKKRKSLDEQQKGELEDNIFKIIIDNLTGNDPKWVASNYENCFKKAANKILKLFAVPDVSNRRELLIAFSEWTMRNEDSPNYITEADVEQYLSN